MAWSRFYEFNAENIEAFAPERQGIYRIALLEETSAFKAILDDDELIWHGIYEEPDIPDLALERIINNRFLAGKYRNDVYSNLVYVGRSSNSIKNRLSKHFSDNREEGNLGIFNLLKYGINLRFSYLTIGYDKSAEDNFFQDFFDYTGYCPPCDQGSNECLRAGGSYIKCYLEKPYGKTVRNYLIC